MDLESVARMVEHHVRLGVDGLFLAGTCGEGPWMSDRQKLALVQAVRENSAGRLRLAVQVTDNSAERVLEQIHALDGVDFAVVAQPYLAMNISRRPCDVITRRSLIVARCRFVTMNAARPRWSRFPKMCFEASCPIRTCSWYPLTPECSAMIDRVLVDERAWLLPS